MRVACVGEAMVELNIDAPERQIGYAGDTFNTAAYLSRALAGAGEVEFVTVLGKDAISDRMEAFFQSQGVGTARIRCHPDRLPGIYAIAVDEAGERSFTYWRDQSAARTLFEDGFDVLEGMDLIYLSGITLAILPPERRAALLAHLAAHPARVAFDSNYRPRLWESPEVARKTIEAAWKVADIALPSLDDEQALFGDADAEAVLARLRSYGLAEGALKQGDAGPLAIAEDVPAQKFPRADRVVDTTAAGDSFNGGFLAAILHEQSTEQAMAEGHALAMRVIGQPGAIIPR
ncbi:MAG: sugar kinase [Maritimibacter sp.]